MPPILGVILEQVFEKGGPAAMQLFAIAHENADEGQRQELSRQLGVDANLQIRFARVLEQMGAVATAPAPNPEPAA